MPTTEAACCSAERFQLVSLLEMLKNYAKEFYHLGALLKGLQAEAHFGPSLGYEQLDQQDVDRVVRHCDAILASCQNLKLPLSVKALKRLQQELPQTPTHTYLDAALPELERRIQDELDSVLFKHVASDKSDYYTNPELVGANVIKRFSKAAFDLDEAGKCFALNRSTACVMHLMRALEIAMDALGLGIGLQDVVVHAKNSWTVALKCIGDQIGANDKSGDPVWAAKSAFFKDSRAYLFAVKVAFRDPSMHLEKKYIDEEAERIYTATKGFMQHLAEHLNESGTFVP